MVIAARGKKRRLLAVALGYLEPEHVAIKTDRLLKVRYLEMHMANTNV